jgi:hypothetical protein
MGKLDWFSNRGQIIQIGLGFLALLLAAYVALPQMSVGAFFSAGALLLYILVLLGMAFYSLAARNALTAGKDAPANSDKKELPEYNATASYKEIRLTPGNFWSETQLTGDFKITLHGLAEEGGKTRADIEVSRSGATHGGTMTKRIDTDRYLVPPTEKYVCEPGSLFSFISAKDSLSATVIRVEHINVHTKEVLLSLGRMRAFRAEALPQ